MPNRQRKASPAFTNLFSVIHHRMLGPGARRYLLHCPVYSEAAFVSSAKTAGERGCLLLLRQSVEHVEFFLQVFFRSHSPTCVQSSF